MKRMQILGMRLVEFIRGRGHIVENAYWDTWVWVDRTNIPVIKILMTGKSGARYEVQVRPLNAKAREEVDVTPCEQTT